MGLNDWLLFLKHFREFSHMMLDYEGRLHL